MRGGKMRTLERTAQSAVGNHAIVMRSEPVRDRHAERARTGSRGGTAFHYSCR